MDFHGVLVQVAGCGVLIQGPAGSGKSQLALELLNRGHKFVGDDLIHLQRYDNALYGRGVGACSQFLSLHCGLVVNVARRFSNDACLPQCRIDLIISQGLSKDLAPNTTSLFGLNLTRYALLQLPQAATIVEAIAADWQDRQTGLDARKELSDRCMQLIAQSA